MEAPTSPLRLSPPAGPITSPRPGQALQTAGPVALIEQIVCHLLQVLQVCLHQHASQAQEIAVMWVLHWGTDPCIRKLPGQSHPLGKDFPESYPALGEGPPLQLKDLSFGSQDLQDGSSPTITCWVRLTWSWPQNACPALLTLHGTPGVAASPHWSGALVPHYLA